MPDTISCDTQIRHTMTTRIGAWHRVADDKYSGETGALSISHSADLVAIRRYLVLSPTSRIRRAGNCAVGGVQRACAWYGLACRRPYVQATSHDRYDRQHAAQNAVPASPNSRRQWQRTPTDRPTCNQLAGMIYWQTWCLRRMIIYSHDLQT